MIFSVVPGRKIHLWLIVIVLHAILTICLQDFLFFCLKYFCDLEFALSHYFEYLKCLITRTEEPKKFNVQTATKFTFFENLSNMFICYIIGAGVMFTVIFFVDPGGKIHLWLIVAVLNAILLLCLRDFLFFCLKPVCVLEFTGFSSLFEYQKWRMTRTKEPRKNDLQTTSDLGFTFPESQDAGS